MSAKHFINDPAKLVNDALRGVTISNPAVALDQDHKVIYRRSSGSGKSSRVSIVSGGGSGHEPSFVDLVGDGLLTAAVAGSIFASPNAKQVHAALTNLVDASAGILVIVMNYTGDVLNFGVAVERAKAAGLRIKMLVVGDDVGVGRKKGGKVGRRGIAGTVLAQKIAGALAAHGASLDTVYQAARLASENIVSVGASLDHVHIPGHARPSQQNGKEHGIDVDQVELGMGIHNETGFMRISANLLELVSLMLRQMLDPADSDRAFVKMDSENIVLLVNNLGGLSVLELSAITCEVSSQLEATYSLRPVRVFSGTYMTSLNGAGFSISLFNVPDTKFDGLSMIQLLDLPAEAKGWPNSIRANTWDMPNTTSSEGLQAVHTVEPQVISGNITMNASLATEALSRGLKSLIAAEPEITEFDTITGDGDCGFGLKRGAEGILGYITQKGELSSDVVAEVAEIGRIIEDTMDGTSGALYAIFFNALVQTLSALPAGEASPQSWARVLHQSSATLLNYTPAKPGDRTVIDALYPFVKTLSETHSLRDAAKASQKGAESTRGMKASLGRTVYVGGTDVAMTPDPGAWGLARFLCGIAGIEHAREG